MTKIGFLSGIGVGVAALYLFNPVSGECRRRDLRDKSATLVSTTREIALIAGWAMTLFGVRHRSVAGTTLAFAGLGVSALAIGKQLALLRALWDENTVIMTKVA